MEISRLDTPCAVIDLDVLERNARVMSERASRLEVALRPHVKTHKCVEAARIQASGSFGGITVSTLAEAEFFASAGFRDITYAVPLAGGKVERACRIAGKVPRLNLLVDGEQAVADVEACARMIGGRVRVFLKVDCGYHRAGVDPESGPALELAKRIAGSALLDFRGILTHAGQAYRCAGRNEIMEVARLERDIMLEFGARLENSGVPVHEISIGSTPTMSVAEKLDGITEIRPGNYLFHDAFQAAIGSCSMGDVAFTVLATVLAIYPARGQALLDAGSLALSSDPGPTHVDPGCGYGIPIASSGSDILSGAHIAALSQEHAVMNLGPERAGGLQPGDRIRIIPNHSCLAAAMFDRYHVTRNGKVVDIWEPVKGW